MIERALMGHEVIWDGVFGGRMEDKKHVIECFERHNQKVIDSVPQEQLLVYRPGDGWEPLCEFLQKPLPGADYPRVTIACAHWHEAHRGQNEHANARQHDGGDEPG